METIQTIQTIQTIWSDTQMGYNHKYIDGVSTSCWLIYKPRYAIWKAIDGYLHTISRDPSAIQQIMANTPVSVPLRGGTESIFFNLNMAYPQIPFSSLLIDTIKNAVFEHIRSITTVVDDITFMVIIGKQRNWKQNCCICLEERIGDHRGWGGSYCRIVIFRPCGHSVCERCFRDFTTCPLCRTPIASIINHQEPLWSAEIIDGLANKVCNKLFIN